MFINIIPKLIAVLFGGTIMVTIGLTNLSSLTRLRKACKEEMGKYFEKTKYEKFVDELVHHRVQGNMKKLLSKE